MLQQSDVTDLGRTRTDLPALRIALLLGVAMTVISAAGSWIPSLWGDEATSVLSAERPVPSLFVMLGRVDAVHGTYYLFLHYWVAVFGSSPFSVRFPSSLAVGLTVVGVVLLTHRLADLRTAIFAGVVCLVLPRFTYMGEEARGYAFSAACVVWATLLLVRIIQDQSPSRRTRALYAVSLALCGYIFLFSLLILVVHLIVVVSLRQRRLTVLWMRSVALALVLALPIIGFGFFQKSQISFLANRSAASFSSVFVGQWFGDDVCAVVCWTLILASIGVAVMQRIRRIPLAGGIRPTPDIVLLAAAWLIVPAAILLTVNFIDPIYSSRYLSFAAPAAAILIGSLLGRLQPRPVAAILLVGVIISAAPPYLSERTPYSKNGSDWAVVAAFIGNHARPGDGMLFDEGINPSKKPRLGMRVYPDAYRGLVDIGLATLWWKTDYWSDSTVPVAEVPRRLVGINTIWLTEYRAPGSSTFDRYDLATLASSGFTEVKRTQFYSDVVVELTRP